VNEVIRTWFNESRDRRVVLVDPADPRREGAPEFLHQLAYVDARRPDTEPRPPKRFRHLSGTASDVLSDAINVASA
jgi:hypothetical protein